MCIHHPLINAVFQNLTPIIDGHPYHFLLACSGGADSTALLVAFHHLRPRLSCRLTVITVNHNIRSAAESSGDSAFVVQLCGQLRPPIPCITAELPVGAVAHCARTRGRGTEDAARVLRYRVFEKTAASVGADFIVTAHNQGDVYETVLMHLFQGASTASLQAMALRRGRYLRPFITVERSSIESFLRQQRIEWREDATNAQDVYLRNRIRHQLLPALTAVFGGWRSGIDKTMQRIGLDRSFCEQALAAARKHFAGSADWKICKHGAIAIQADFFDSLHPALRLRILEQGCLKLDVGMRVSLGILLRLSSELSKTPEESESAAVLEAPLYAKIAAAGNLRLERRGVQLFLFKTDAYLALYNQKSYSLTITKCGLYVYPLGQLEVYKIAEGIFIRDSEDKSQGIGPLTLPLSIRSRRGGDRIQMSSGKLKEVKKILNEWHVDSLARELLPIIIEDSFIQKCTRIRALYGSMLGYKNWFVEE